MSAVTFTKFKDGKGRMSWLANDLSGLSISRERSVIDGEFYYPVSTYSATSGNRVIADFNTLAEAKSFVVRQAGA